MIGRSPSATVLAAMLVLIFGARAGFGWVGGPSLSRGKRLAAAGRHELALPALERAAVGMQRAEARWLAGEVRVGMRYELLAQEGVTERTRGVLRQAGRDYSEAVALSPASGWYWAGLGQVYHQLERAERHTHGVPLEILVADSPWHFVGRPGRIAIGLTRMAIQREPAVYEFHDQLALILFDYRLEQPALAEVRRSARAQPIFHFHRYRDLVDVSTELLAAFADASREALGHAPMLRRVTHLLALGKVELQRGEYVRAEQDLRAALEVPASRLERAEIQLHLGRALAGQERWEEAVAALQLAKVEPVMRSGALQMEAHVALRQGELERALELYREARRLSPRRIDLILQFARIARQLGRWDQAIQALDWARVIAPAAAEPRVELVLTYIEQGELAAARRALSENEAVIGAAASRRLRRGIDERAATGVGALWRYKEDSESRAPAEE